MQETRHQHEDSHLATPLDTAISQGGTAIHLSLSHLSTQEMGKELEKRKQAFARSLIIVGIVSTSGVLINHALFVFPPVTPAQQNAYGMTLTLLVGGGIVIVWNYRYIQGLKQQLCQRTNDQSTQTQKEKDNGSSDSCGSRR